MTMSQDLAIKKLVLVLKTYLYYAFFYHAEI